MLPVLHILPEARFELGAMNIHVHAEYAPPRSWEQFEELCADIFQATWRDPALVRHGRAGQRQNGVDIVARQGGRYPIGLQCKRRSRWPVKKLRTDEIDTEILEAKKFDPPLESFYILTTAEDDAKLQGHVRAINKLHKTQGLFNVVLLGWGEIVRRATLHEDVANKHFGRSGGEPRSPLLATWFCTKGKLELSGRELGIALKELAQDLQDWPMGRVVVRQRESDALLDRLHAFVGRDLGLDEREERINLRDELRRMTDREARAIQGLMLMLSEEPLRTYMTRVYIDDGHLAAAVHAHVENSLNPNFSLVDPNHTEARVRSPRDPETRMTIYMPKEAVSEILLLQQKRTAEYGRPLTDTIDELPSAVRAAYAIPAVIRKILFMMEDGATLAEVRAAGHLDLGSWRFDFG